MPRRILVSRDDERFDLVEVDAANELSLQEILRANPQLIPADDLGFDRDLLVVGRETPLAAVYVDLLCLASSGDLVIIELKTGRQNPDFRHALAQLIDYGSDLWTLGLEDFDTGVVQAYLTSRHVDPARRRAQSLRDLVATTNWGLDDDGLLALETRLQHVLATGDFVFVVAAQNFTASMRASVDYLNDTARAGRYFLVELIELRGQGLHAFQAQVVAKPPAKRATSQRAGALAGEDAFLKQVVDEDYRETLREILARCRTLSITCDWGVRGAALRLPVSDTTEPLSIGWVFGDTPSWYGLTHLTLGVDHSSLANRPSAHDAVQAYVTAAKALPDATPVNRSTLEAVTFDPAATVHARADITTLLEGLVARVNGEPTAP